MDQEQIGKWIALLRKEKKLTQEQLAERLGVSNRSVSRWENGRNMPDFSLLWDIAGELGVTVPELLNGKRMEEEADAEVLGSVDMLLAWSGREKQSKAKRLGSYFGAGMVCLLLALGQSEFGILSVLFPKRADGLLTGVLAALGAALQLAGFACNRQNAFLTQKEIELLSKNAGGVRMKDAQEMLRFAQKYRSTDKKNYRVAFAEVEKNLEEGESVVFSATGEEYSKNEWQMMWHTVLAVTEKRMLIGGERMKGLLLPCYEAESYLFSDISRIGRSGSALVIQTSEGGLKIHAGNADAAEEIEKELRKAAGMD